MHRTLVRRIVRSRLTHFIAFGAALHLLAPGAGPSRVVDVDPAALAAVHRAEADRIGAPTLDPSTSHTVDARLIEDELLYREALRLGLEDDDPIVKQRLVQKLLLLVEDLGGAGREPTDDELRAYFDANPNRWRRASRVRFVHVFSSSLDRLPEASAFHADRREPPPLGEAFPYPRVADDLMPEIERVFGPDFARSLATLHAGDESGPIRSRLGWHRVRILERDEGRAPTFDEVRGEIRLDWSLDRREAVVGAWMKKTASQYDIRVGGKRLDHFEPTRRVAVRAEGSAED